MLRRGESIGVFQLEGGADAPDPDALARADELRRRGRPGRALPARARWRPTCTTTTPSCKNGRKQLTYLHPDIEPILEDTYGLMIYQESVMRVAQKFAGYSLEEADNLRKACGKKIRALIAAEREKFVAGCVDAGLRRGARHAALRHHRAVRRLRLQQVALLRLRPRGLPDGLAQGALPGRVHGGAAHVGEGQQGQDGGLPGRVPLHGDRGAGARRQPLGGRVRAGPVRATGDDGRHGHRLRAGGGAQRRRGPRRADRRRARGQRALRRHLRLLPAGRPGGAEQADDGVAGQGRRLRLARPPAPGPVPRPRGDRRPDAGAAARAGPRHHHALRRLRGGAGRPGLGRRPRSPSPTPSSTRPSGWPSRRRCSGST